VLVQGVAPQSSNDSCDLPKDLQSLVAARYHGTKIVILSDLNEDDKQLFQKEHAEGCPGLAKVDFYGEWQANTGVSADQIESGQPYHKAFGFSCLQECEGCATLKGELSGPASLPIVFKFAIELAAT